MPAAFAALKAALAHVAKLLRARRLFSLLKSLPRLLLLLLLAGASSVFWIFLLVIVPVLFVTGVFGPSTPAAGEVCGVSGAAGASDPIGMDDLQIAITIYGVGREMGMGDREIVTAFAVVLVESDGGVTMRNPRGGLGSSTGAFQQQDSPEWTKPDANGNPTRNRNNVSDAARTFFEELRKFDHGQDPGELAADIQRPLEELRGKYAAAMPRAQQYLNRVKAELGAGGSQDATQLASAAPAASCGVSTGPANLNEVRKLSEPRTYKMLPRSVMAGGRAPEVVDARIYNDAVWVISTYHLAVTAARENGHHSHGEGTALDMVPANGSSHQAWVQSAQRLAEDLGWTAGCGSSGLSSEFGGACHLKPAIRFIGYNGYPGHGEGNHIHVSWQDALSPGASSPTIDPVSWVKVFPAPAPSEGKRS